MKSPRRRPMRFLLSAAVALVALAMIPSIASALTITVDDDRAQCPLADETTLTAAVAAAANGDTVKVCAGTYNVPGGPAPSSGLKIEKNISIVGAGSDKVFVQPTQSAESMAQAVPNPRDEYGNIITVRRRLIELYDVSISGLTVKAGTVPVEAGISMIDVNTGTISGVKVEGIVPGTGPGTGAFEPPAALAEQGQGIIVANTIEETSNVTTITGSQISGFNSTGILVDNRGLVGTGSVGNNSFVTAKITNTRITAATSSPVIGQTGIEAWGSGARVQLTKSKISKAGKADASAAAVELHGVDIANSFLGGSEAERDDFTDNLYGVTNVAYDGSPALASLNATSNFWGTTVNTGVPLVSTQVSYEPLALSAPAATTLAAAFDNLPTGQWDTAPAENAVVAPGTPISLAVVAGDDFGVKQVEFKINGGSLGVSPTPTLLGERVYTGSWTPIAGQAGTGNVISAVVTDSASQTTTINRTVTVEGKPHFTASPTISGLTSGYAVVGKPLTCSSGTAAAYPAPTYSYSWTVAGAAAGTATSTYTPVAADQGKNVACTVKATNSFGSASAGGGPVLVASVPALASAAKLTGASGTYALVGDELTCSAGAASGNPVPTVSYAWTRGGSPIAGTTTHTVEAADIGSLLTCTVAAESVGGSVSSPASVTAGAVPAFTNTAATLSVLNAGFAVSGSSISCSSGSPTGSPTPTVTYAWTAGGSPVGTDSSTYTPVAADAGKALVCKVTVTNPITSIEASSSAATIAVTPAFSAAAGITGATGGTYALKGNKLTCAAGTATGSPAPTVTYVWKRDGTAIVPAATAKEYSVVEADVGHLLTCALSATNAVGAVSDSAAITAGEAPHFTTTAGLIGGTTGGYAVVGTQLSCSSGNPAGSPTLTVTYAWTANGSPVGANSSTYTPGGADAGKAIGCKVTITNAISSANATSGTATVATGPTFSSAAKLSGVSGLLGKAGDTLQCSATGAGDPAPTVSYTWLREGTAIAGQTASTYTVVAADEGHEISCKARAESIAGSATSVATVGVGSAPKEGAPALTGAVKVGSTLTCASGTWTAIPKAAFTYSWLRNGAVIAGQTGATYVSTLGEVGAQISCKVTATNSLGSGEATTTALAVTAAPPTVLDLGGATKLSGAKVKVGTVSCDVGPCISNGPKKIKVKIGTKKYAVKVILPASLASGETGPVSIELGKAARKALKEAGKSAKFKFTVGAEGGGGSATAVIAAQLS